MSDLRALCVAYIAANDDPDYDAGDPASYRLQTDTGLALAAALGTPGSIPRHEVARAIIAALDESATERELRAYRRESEALAAADILGREVVRLQAEINRLNTVIGEMSE